MARDYIGVALSNNRGARLNDRTLCKVNAIQRF